MTRVLFSPFSILPAVFCSGRFRPTRLYPANSSFVPSTLISTFSSNYNILPASITDRQAGTLGTRERGGGWRPKQEHRLGWEICVGERRGGERKKMGGTGCVLPHRDGQRGEMSKMVWM